MDVTVFVNTRGSVVDLLMICSSIFLHQIIEDISESPHVNRVIARVARILGKSLAVVSASSFQLLSMEIDALNLFAKLMHTNCLT